MKVELSAEAEAQVLEIDAWWRENRTAVADLFTDELEHALSSLEDTPTLGARYNQRPEVRRLLLPRTHYHVYFVQETDRLYIAAVWSAFRGRGPEL